MGNFCIRARDIVLKAILINAALIVFSIGGGQAKAQTCGNDYVIKEGESLSQIAAKAYGNESQWTMIFYANQDRIGSNASLIVPGISIRIPCIGAKRRQALPVAATARATPSKPQQFVLSTLVRRIEFLTADGYAPFTGRALPNGGMLTEMISASMELVKKQSPQKFDYKISWVNDWAAHLDPLLINRAFDAGFPWSRSKCENFAILDKDTQYRCRNFFFSDPLFELFTVLVVKKKSPFVFTKDEDIIGKTLCQPVGYSTYELDQDGRNWIRDSKIVLMRPQTPEDCFRLLDQNAIDAVVTSDLTGRAVVTSLGMADRVRILNRPLSIGTLNIIVTKTNPHARTLLYYMNSAIATLKEGGDYDRIVQSHLSRFWDAQQSYSARAQGVSAADPTQKNIKQNPAAKTSSIATPKSKKGKPAKPGN